MPTEELEYELRRAFTAAAADYPDAELARQRLLRRTYRPRGGHRGLVTGLAAAATAAATAAGLVLSGALSPAREAGTIRTAAFTLTRNANGTDTLAITDATLFDPQALEDELARFGVPAKVTVGRACYTMPPVAGLSESALRQLLPRVAGSTVPNTLVINPALIPAGTELSIAYLPLQAVALRNTKTGKTVKTLPMREFGMTLISQDSYTCASKMADAWSKPSLPMLWWIIVNEPLSGGHPRASG